LAWRPDVDSVPAPLFSSEYREISPTVSPDGRWIAYASDETGRYEIYVRPFPDVSAGRWQASIGGGRNPQWALNGQELFFQGPTQEMMVVEFEGTTSEFVARTPAVLFQSDLSWLFMNLTRVLYDVAPDDQHFLIGAVVQATSGSTDDGPPPPSVVLVNNFVEELKRRVGN
jgi:serine/threonine-protein kinase